MHLALLTTEKETDRSVSVSGAAGELLSTPLCPPLPRRGGGAAAFLSVP